MRFWQCLSFHRNAKIMMDEIERTLDGMYNKQRAMGVLKRAALETAIDDIYPSNQDERAQYTRIYMKFEWCRATPGDPDNDPWCSSFK